MMIRSVQALSLLGALACCTGCGRDGPKLQPVRGQVLFEGKATPHALVVLHPLGSSRPEAPRPRGQVAGDGTFVLGSFGADDGALPGEYAVTVEWLLSPATGRGKGDDLPPSNRLPERYSRPETSRLRVAIKEGVNELPVIRLSK